MFDYGYKDTATFLHFQIFLNFFYTFFSLSAIIHIYTGFSVSPESSLFRWWCVPVVVFRRCAGPGPGRVSRWPFAIYTRIHAHTHARARGFLDRNF